MERQCRSPLEEIFRDAFIQGCERSGVKVSTSLEWEFPPDDQIVLVNQPDTTLGKRLDFALWFGPNACCYVECDGYAYHKSPAQFDRDRQISNHGTLSDVPVFRFSGRRINKDADGCAAQVFEYLNGKRNV